MAKEGFVINTEEVIKMFSKESKLMQVKAEERIDGAKYMVTAYKISNPHKLIRIDIKEK